MSSAVTKPASKDVSRPSNHDSVLEAKEHSAKAEASAGLNLNIFGALSGAFASKSKKETAPDGSSYEEREEQLRAQGAGAANLQAQAAARAEEKGRQMRQAIKEGNA